METRLALAACVVLGCALCGRATAEAARRRGCTLRALTDGLKVLRIHMTGMLEPVQSALVAANCALYSMVAEGMAGGRSAGESWRSVRAAALRRGGPGDALSEADARVLDGLFDRLGESGRAEQGTLIGATLESMEALRDQAEKKAAEAGRLHMSLGLLVGLMLALIFV